MAMFDKKDKSKQQTSSAPQESVELPDMQPPVVPEPASKRQRAMIGASINIKGEVSGDENLLIEGKVEGSVNLGAHEVCIGPAGRVDADVVAKTIKIEGEVKGDIRGTEKVVIAKSGNVRGNIIAPRVTLEDGAKFKGSIDMDPSEGSASVSSLSSAKPESSASAKSA